MATATNHTAELEIVLDLVKAINRADTDAIHALLANDHVFIDARENTIEGKDEMKDAWIKYFELFSEYRIEIVDILTNDSVIGLFGYASAICKVRRGDPENSYWRIPACWKAIVEQEKVAHWQVYCDLEKVDRIFGSRK